uniref:Acyl-CoA binding domain containing 4 n=1 Tax=Echeneis naucrates TaxID=173247 RepID=A0A665T4G5_ECHNA
MTEPVLDHQKRFQAAVDVIHNLPKSGSYRPSYEVMLRFYSLYKQAVCGPCTVPRPGFWDPVGRYKWDSWRRLGQMSSENAMAVYVDELKKVAQEVIDSMPMNEKTASLMHIFEPLYLVIDDMPRPQNSLFTPREDLEGSENAERPAVLKSNDEEQDHYKEDASLPEDPEQEFSLAEVVDLTTNTIPSDSGVSECLVLTSDSESEIFCDSVDSVEQLQRSNIKIPVLKSNGFQSGSMLLESSLCLEARQVGSGQGGEGAEDGKGPGPISRRPDTGRGGYYHNWRERCVPQDSPQWGGPGGGGGGGRGGGDGSEGGTERLHETQLQQQIIVALRRLREDMRSVMDRLEAHGSEWTPCLHCAAQASHPQERWWSFVVSGQTIFLFLVWPFVAQGLVYLLRKAQRSRRISS